MSTLRAIAGRPSSRGRFQIATRELTGAEQASTLRRLQRTDLRTNQYLCVVARTAHGHVETKADRRRNRIVDAIPSAQLVDRQIMRRKCVLG